MQGLYIEALYNRNRNAIPSWQGYHYQAQVAVYYFLKYILSSYEDNRNNIEDICLKIEWLEDFIIFEGESVKQIYQVKKTLGTKEYEDVIGNFITQYLVSNNGCNWYVIFDKLDDPQLSKIEKDTFESLYDIYIENSFKKEIELLMNNYSDEAFWREHLKLRMNGENKSQLSGIRHFINNLLKSENKERNKISIDEFEEFITGHYNILIDRLQLNEETYLDFSKHVYFQQEEIKDIFKKTRDIVDKLDNKEYIQKSRVFSSEKIVDILYIIVYEKLMEIENKNEMDFIIKFSDVKKVFSCENMITYLWQSQLGHAMRSLSSKIDRRCNNCIKSQKCSVCIMSEVKEINLGKYIDKMNLEYARMRPENIQESISQKLSDAKINYLVKLLYDNKDKEIIKHLRDKNNLELNYGLEDFFVSMHIADPDEDSEIEEKLICNILEHEEVYREYENILTKNFEWNLDFDQLKLIQNYQEEELEEKIPHFLKLMPINFKSKKLLEE